MTEIKHFDIVYKSNMHGLPQIPCQVKILPTVEKKSAFTIFRANLWTFRIVLGIIFILTGCGAGVSWFTELFNNHMNGHLILGQNTSALDWWISPPIHPYLRVYFFNYTNIDAFLSGVDKKLKLEEVGPYVYSEYVDKVEIEYNQPDHTISYKEKRTVIFEPHLTPGNESDIITIPNVLFLSAVKFVKHDNVFVKFGLQNILAASGSSVFKTHDVKSLLWGYEDKLIEFLRKLPGTNIHENFHRFGLFSKRNGTGDHRYVIHTGESDITKLNKFIKINNITKMEHWTTDECNSIDGTDGSQFPPNELDKHQILNVFAMELCRSFPLTYVEDVNLFDGIPAWRYEISTNIFAHPSINPENQCYCYNNTVCPYSGLFNATICSEGAPIFFSFPHFYGADKVLSEKFEGLKPDPIRHITYADVHPRLAFPIDGASRFQVNVETHIPGIIAGLDKFEDGNILPIMWFEIIAGEFPEYVLDKIYHSSFSANVVQILLKYGMLTVAVSSLILFICSFLCCEMKSSRKFIKSLNNGIPLAYKTTLE